MESPNLFHIYRTESPNFNILSYSQQSQRHGVSISNLKRHYLRGTDLFHLSTYYNKVKYERGSREPSRFSSEGKFSLSNVHPCLLHLADGLQHVIVRLAGHFCNLEWHQLKFQPMYFHPTSQRLTREKIPPLTFSHTGSTCDERLHVFKVDHESRPVIPLVQWFG